jgi:exodeoxyribonuclease VII large subunit
MFFNDHHTRRLFMQEVWTVSRLAQAVKKSLEFDFPQIWVEGEIANCKRYPSGHLYFSLKDTQSHVSCVMFAGFNRFLPFTPTDGLQVKIRGKASLYPDRGQFQLLIDYMEESGDGALKRAFELLKQKLFSEGLFSEIHKQALPPFPQCIGVVTSPQGAAIEDILTTLKRRFPAIPVIIYPSTVQGNKAAQEICQAIALANRHAHCDVLIVGRGGGSLQDLQAFNEESVARAIFASKIPIISAVGHEVDITIADFVADMRAATPTAAAELVAPDQTAILALIKRFKERLIQTMNAQIEEASKHLFWLQKSLKNPESYLEMQMQTQDRITKQLYLSIFHYLKHHDHRLQQLEHRLMRHHPKHQLLAYDVRLKTLYERLMSRCQVYFVECEAKLGELSHVLHNLSPLQTLSRGYSINQDSEGHVITSTDGLQCGDSVTTILQQGKFKSVIHKIYEK